MADTETGKIENDKEKIVIEESTSDGVISEIAEVPSVAADTEITEDRVCTEEDQPSSLCENVTPASDTNKIMDDVIAEGCREEPAQTDLDDQILPGCSIETEGRKCLENLEVKDTIDGDDNKIEEVKEIIEGTDNDDNLEVKDIIEDTDKFIPLVESHTYTEPTESTKDEVTSETDQSTNVDTVLCTQEDISNVDSKEDISSEEHTELQQEGTEIEMLEQPQIDPKNSPAQETENEEMDKKSDNSVESQREEDMCSNEKSEHFNVVTDNTNEDSNLVSDTLKPSSSDSSLDSKKEYNDDMSNGHFAVISSDTLQLPMEIDSESLQSETPLYNTPGPATPASSILDTGSVSAGPTPSKRSRQNSTDADVASEDTEIHTFSASKLFEYQWPQDSSGEYYMLQEQISEFLAVKSFKRKYPELQRRPVEMNERVYLREKGAVTETQCDLGLTAIRSDEVYDLMHRDYPDKYAEYAAVLHERERQKIKEKHKDYEVPKLEKSKMTEYIKKAMKSASEWNTNFLREKKEERRAYFDLQTFNVHYPVGRFKVLPPDLTTPSPYPVTLIPGQYQDYYKNHSSEELKYLPLNTAMYNPPKDLGNKLANPQEALSEDASEEDVEGGGGSDSDSDDDSSSEESEDSSGQDSGQAVSEDTVNDDKVKGEESLMCRICEKQGEAVDDMVQCSECKKYGHPSCLDVTMEMVTVIRTYPWQCMECKTCVECMDPYDEDKMIFCDRCDRGYHTFCVGLRSIPTGQWKCRSCKTSDLPRTPRSTSKPRGRGRKRGSSTPAKDG